MRNKQAATGPETKLAPSSDDVATGPDEVQTPLPGSHPPVPKPQSTVLRERARLVIELLTLAAVSFYGFVAYCQWSAMITANKQTKTALHISERAYITADTPILNKIDKIIAFDITNSGHIPSGNIEVIAHEATFNVSRNVPPEIASATEYHWKRHKVASLPPGKRIVQFARASTRICGR